jgi:hypothetical protein
VYRKSIDSLVILKKKKKQKQKQRKKEKRNSTLFKLTPKATHQLWLGLYVNYLPSSLVPIIAVISDVVITMSPVFNSVWENCESLSKIDCFEEELEVENDTGMRWKQLIWHQKFISSGELIWYAGDFKVVATENEDENLGMNGENS